MSLQYRFGLIIAFSLLAFGTPAFADDLRQLNQTSEDISIDALEALDETATDSEDDGGESIAGLGDLEDTSLEGDDTGLSNDEDDILSSDTQLSVDFSGYVKAMAYWKQTNYARELWAQFQRKKAGGFPAPDEQKEEGYNYTGVRTQLKLEAYLGEKARLFSAFNLDFNETGQADSDGYPSTVEENRESRLETIRMVEAFIELYEGSRTWKVGTQLVTWSYMEGFETPTDRLNARDQTYPSSEYEDTKLPSTGILLTQGLGDNTLEVVYVPVGKVSLNPIFTDYLYTGGQRLRESTPEHSKWAGRFTGSFYKLDYAASYVDGTDLQADASLLDASGNVMVHDPSAGPLQLAAALGTYDRPVRTYHRTRSPGLDLHYNCGSWIPKAAFVYYLTEDEDGDDPFIKNHWSQYMIGGEFKVGSATLNLYAGQTRVEDYKEETLLDLQTNYLNGQKRKRTDFVSGYVDADFLTGNALKLNLMFANYWDEDGEQVESKLKATFKYKIADGLEIYLAPSYFEIDGTEITDLQTEVKYSF
ncbi:MAG: hypothetical protein GY866_29160 [Proteobacteria bacterium]|nr:hypothetical protein [Pseudomonadota bacterium]